MDRTLQVLKSTTTVTPVSLLFGELSVSDVSNNVNVYIGDSLQNPIKIFDQATPTEFVYENDKNKYVAINGSDSNNGQSGYPFETITFGQTQIIAGGALILEGGIYNEDLLFQTVDSRKALLGTPTTNNYNVTEISRNIELNEAAEQITFAYLEFSEPGASIKHIWVNSSSSNANMNFQNITASGSTGAGSHVVYVSNVAGSAGYINVDGCDFAGRRLTLENSTLPRYCFISNSRNITLSAGINWVVFVDESSTISEISNNGNIVDSNSVSDIIGVNPVAFGIYLLSAELTINSVVYPKGNLIFWNGVSVSFTSRYYVNKPMYFVVAKNACYVKTGSLEYSEVTSYPIVL